MSRVNLNYASAHALVDASIYSPDLDIRWEGWDLVIHTPTPWGFTAPAGAFRKERTVERRGKRTVLPARWGMEIRVSPDKNGIWKVNHKNVRPF